MPKRVPTAIVLLAASCGVIAAASTPVRLAPTGAAVGPDGSVSILHAPPAPFTPSEPGPPQPLTAGQRAGHEQFARAGRFQNEVREEVQALAETLRRREKGNFVDLYYENEGEPHVVFRFLRDPQRTLAKYTKHPRFRAGTARYTNEQLRAAMDFMLETFREDRVILGAGTGNKQNRVEVRIGMTEPEFRALVAKKGVTIPEAVELHFAARRPASVVNQPLPPHIARFVKIFPRDDRPTGLLHSIDSRAKIVLREGCFRIDGGEHDRALVLFPLGAQLFLDSDGYLAFGASASPGYARVGETVVTPGTIGEVAAPALVEPIRKACGAGKVVKVHGLRSDSARRAENRVHSNAQALRSFRETYGLSEAQARKVLEGCKARSGFETCLITPPAPPPPGGLTCPADTKASFGLCRTPEGFIRPIPQWIQDLIRD